MRSIAIVVDVPRSLSTTQRGGPAKGKAMKPYRRSVHIMAFVITVRVTASEGSATAARRRGTPFPRVWTDETPPGLPDIRQWMLTAQGVPSDWLGESMKVRTSASRQCEP